MTNWLLILLKEFRRKSTIDKEGEQKSTKDRQQSCKFTLKFTTDINGVAEEPAVTTVDEALQALAKSFLVWVGRFESRFNTP